MKRLVCLCGSLFLASNVTAATITDDVTFTFGGTAIASECCNYGATSVYLEVDIFAALDKFDATLGTLTDVAFNLTSILATNPAFSPFKLEVTGFAAGNGEFHSAADSLFTTRIK